MSLSQLTPQTLKRLPHIKEGLLKGNNYTTIGQKCGVTERTIDRDIKSWLQSGDFEDWIKTMWIELHGKITAEDPTEAYRQVSKLMAKMITQKQEIKADVNQTISEIKVSIIDNSRTATEDAPETA